MPVEKAPVQAEAPADPRAKLAWEIVTHYVHDLGSFGLSHPTHVPAYANHEKVLATLQQETLEQLRELFRKSSEALSAHGETKANLLLCIDAMVEHFGDKVSCYERIFGRVEKDPEKFKGQEGFRMLHSLISETVFSPAGVSPA